LKYYYQYSKKDTEKYFASNDLSIDLIVNNKMDIQIENELHKIQQGTSLAEKSYNLQSGACLPRFVINVKKFNDIIKFNTIFWKFLSFYLFYILF